MSSGSFVLQPGEGRSIDFGHSPMTVKAAGEATDEVFTRREATERPLVSSSFRRWRRLIGGGRYVVSLLVTVVFVAACTTETAPPTTESASSTVRVPFDSGVEGTLTRVGSGSGDDGTPLEGQVLVWGAQGEEPAETTTSAGFTAHGRPLEAIDVDNGSFAIKLSPGWYKVRGTAIDAAGGEICDELWVEVKPHEITGVGFACH